MTDEVNFSAPATDTSFRGKETDSVENLVRWIEATFNCHDGPYQAYIVHGGEPLHYQTLSIIAGHRVPDAPQALRARLLHDLIVIYEDLEKRFPDRAAKPTLYWRFAPECRIQEEVRPGRYPLHKIYTRIAIPDADWSLIETKKEGEAAPRIPE